MRRAGLQIRDRLSEPDIILKCIDRYALDLLEHARILRDAHAGQLLGTPVLVELVVSVLPELLHVRPDQHLAQLDKVAMVLIVDLDHTPGVDTAADFASVRGRDDLVGADDGEGDLAGDLLVLRDRLLVLILVGRSLEDVDVVVRDVGKDLVPRVEKGGIEGGNGKLTRALNSATSTSVRVSALAMTGMRLTLSCSCFMNSMSRGFNLRRRVASVRAARRRTKKRKCARVAGGLDEVQAGVNAVVNDFLAVDPVFLLEVGVEAGLDVVHNRLPAGRERVSWVLQHRKKCIPVVVVDKVTEPGSVDDSQTKPDTVFLDVCRRHERQTEVSMKNGYGIPALMLSIATVWGLSAFGGRGTLGG